MDLKEHIAAIPDFPKPGILFYDISTLLRHPDAWQVAMGRMAQVVRRWQPDLLAGVEFPRLPAGGSAGAQAWLRLRYASQGAQAPRRGRGA